MDQIVSIFKQLGVDGTIWTQLAVFTAMFFVLKAILFNKLQFVLEQRELKTNKLEILANKKLEEADKLANILKEKMDLAHERAQQLIKENRDKLLNEQKNKFDEVKKTAHGVYVKEMSSFESELHLKKDQILSQADEMAEELVKKLS